MQLSLNYDLPFATLTISYHGNTKAISNILVDTGSGTTILSADIVAEVGIIPSPEDTLYNIRGVGGSEVVFSRKVNFIQIDHQKITDFEIEIGGMDYGFEINGILGMDFLLRAGATINFRELKIEFAQ
jgi:predicted aspartyl protease